MMHKYETIRLVAMEAEALQKEGKPMPKSEEDFKELIHRARQKEGSWKGISQI